MMDNDILGALRCCGDFDDCDGCTYEDVCGGLKNLTKSATDIIIRQKAEIKKKDIEIDILIRKKEMLRDVIAELQKQIQDYAHTIVMLNDHNKGMHQCCDYAAKHFVADAKRIKADAIKEFADRLKENLQHIPLVVFRIDNLVAEMTGKGGDTE